MVNTEFYVLQVPSEVAYTLDVSIFVV